LDTDQAAREAREGSGGFTNQRRGIPAKTSVGEPALKTRFSPSFSSGMNVIYWITVVLNWIYRHSESIPHQIQQISKRASLRWHDEKWDVMKAEAQEGVNAFLAKEFPREY
jgi:hypothetical protein